VAEFEPEVGLVIRHAYLWQNEARQGREEGVKDRPCVIVDVHENEYGEREVLISPITHTPPTNPERAVQMPLATKQRLGLDDQNSWIITTEVNRFIWPGPDIRSIPGGRDSCGHLPAAMTTALLEKIRANASDRSIAIVRRDDEMLLAKMRESRAKSAAAKGKPKKTTAGRRSKDDRDRER
jgi:hypothetical protein